MPFTPEALLAVHQRSGGTPRVINSICDNALFETFLAREQTVSDKLIHRIADNLGLVGSSMPETPHKPALAANASSRAGGTSKVDLAEIDRYLEGLGKL
jgi:hypothetical protein